MAIIDAITAGGDPDTITVVVGDGGVIKVDLPEVTDAKAFIADFRTWGAKIEAEIKGLQKVKPDSSPETTTRLKYMITSVNGNREPKTVREFVDNALLAPDARALRQYYAQISPDINMKFMPDDENYTGEGIDIPISLNFFWPDFGV